VDGTTEMLGVEFVELDSAPAGATALGTVRLLYDGVDYSALSPGITFGILEGPHVVGSGQVLPD
jgi:hypothetical protein